MSPIRQHNHGGDPETLALLKIILNDTWKAFRSNRTFDAKSTRAAIADRTHYRATKNAISVHKEASMPIPVWVLLGFAAWTLFILFVTVGVYRWSRILTGRTAIAEWRADERQGSEWYCRAVRAHLNCLETWHLR
jgi:hypothetical protein